MIDDDVITRLVELHDHIKVPDTPPGADVLRGERMLRRRRAVVVGAAAAAVVAVLGIAAVTTGGLQAGDASNRSSRAPTRVLPHPDRCVGLRVDARADPRRGHRGYGGRDGVRHHRPDVRLRATDPSPSAGPTSTPRSDANIRTSHSR
jgi:hypothetical protein